MNVIVGCDPSSGKLACVYTLADSGVPTTWVRTLGSQDYTLKCDRARRSMFNFFTNLRDKYPNAHLYLFIEQPVVGRGGAYATIIQAKIHGAAVAGAMEAAPDLVVREVNNSHCKKSVTGKGNADKGAIAAWAKLYWRLAYEASKGDQDVIDAAMINRYGYGVVQKMHRLEQHRKREGKIRTVRRLR